MTPVSFRDGHTLPDTRAPLCWPQQKVNMRSPVSTLPGSEASNRQQSRKHWTPDLTWDCCSGGRSLSPLGRHSSLTGTRTSELFLSKASGTWVHCGPMVMGSGGRATRRLRANVWPTYTAPRSTCTPAAPPQPGRAFYLPLPDSSPPALLLGGPPGHPRYTARPGPTAAPSPSSACTTPTTPCPRCIVGGPTPTGQEPFVTAEPPALENAWQAEGMQRFGKYANLYFFSWFLDASLRAFKTLPESVFEVKPF